MKNKSAGIYWIVGISFFVGFFLLIIWLVGGDLGLWESPDPWGPGWPVLAFIIVPLLVLFLIFLAGLANRGDKFFVAIEESNLVLMRKLLDKRPALANKKDGHGCPALNYAVYRTGDKGTAAASLLIKANADVNGFDNAGATPLHIAARNGNLPLVKLLVENGADPAMGADKSHPYCPGETPLQAAQKARHRAVVEYLLSKEKSG